MTATLGLSTLVATTVAMAFGASVQPLTKIDAQTRIMTIISPITVAQHSLIVFAALADVNFK